MTPYVPHTRGRRFRFVPVIAALACSAPALGDLVTITAHKDATLNAHPLGVVGNGSGQHLFCGKTNAGATRRAVLAFDVAAAVPAGSTINSVTMTLNMSRTMAGTTAVTVRRVTTAWNEGPSDPATNEGGGTLAQTGDTTWLHTFYNTQFWNTAGGDFTASHGMTNVGGPGVYTWGPTPNMRIDVQSWLDAPATNFGWLLFGNESANQTAKRFDSRNHPTPSLRPKLTINFTPPPPCTKGDVNNDGLIDGDDVDGFVSTLLSGGTAQQVCAGDVQNAPDGTVTSADIPNFVQCVLDGACP